jgi:hypothetical protein
MLKRRFALLPLDDVARRLVETRIVEPNVDQRLACGAAGSMNCPHGLLRSMNTLRIRAGPESVA